jgi:hypothetical protein
MIFCPVKQVFLFEWYHSRQLVLRIPEVDTQIPHIPELVFIHIWGHFRTPNLGSDDTSSIWGNLKA